MEEKKDSNDLNKRHFAKLHERIQSKYDEMQRKLEKSKSVDVLTNLKDNYVYHKLSMSSDDLREADPYVNVETDRLSLTRKVIVEEVNTRSARSSVIQKEESISESVDEFIFEKEDFENEHNGLNKHFNHSLESLNDASQDSDSFSIPSTPPPKTSFRHRISSKLTAHREKRKSESAAKENKKKETRQKVEKFILSNTTKQDNILKSFKKSKVATLTIALIEVSGLENDCSEEKPRLMNCRFKADLSKLILVGFDAYRINTRLGTEKYKSKIVKSQNSVAKWQELFNFNVYDENMLDITLWEKDVFIGRTTIDLFKLKKEKTHQMRIDLECEMGSAKLFILLTITGTALMNTLVDSDDYQETQTRLSAVKKNFAWYHILNEVGEVGWLSVIVYGAKGLAASECCCIVELGNEMLHTQTDPKTNDPNWMKVFAFTVKDITEILQVTVHDEKKSEDIGKVSIPLLNIKNGDKKWYALKDVSQRDRAKGNNPRILLEMEVTWSPLRASIRVINPKEEKYLEMDDKFQRHIFARNLSRAKAVFSWTMDAFRIVKSCFEWESKKLNAIALAIWMLFCWFFKAWMLPLLVLIPFVWYRPEKYYLIHWYKYFKKTPMEVEEYSKNEKEEKNTSFRQKIQSFQEMVQTVQNLIGQFATLGESVKNLFNFKVPFLSILAICLISVVALVMYLVPVKYILMIWGVNKFMRKILKPNRIPNNEILDLLSRVPDDETLLSIQELPLEETPKEDDIK